MIKIGRWYEVTGIKEGSIFNNTIKKIKIVPSYRFLESQDPKKDYYEILTSNDTNVIASLLLGSCTLEDCMKEIENNFILYDDVPLNTDLDDLIEELEKDARFLSRDAHKKYPEIALHIKEAITNLKSYSDDRFYGSVGEDD